MPRARRERSGWSAALCASRRRTARPRPCVATLRCWRCGIPARVHPHASSATTTTPAPTHTHPPAHTVPLSQVHSSMRKRGMGSKLVSLAVQGMHDNGCEEAVLEAEVTNMGALRLYESLGFVRDKRLMKYYLNGSDAYRLKVWFPNHREG